MPNSNLPSNLILFCDGGSRGNPGPSACGFVIFEVSDSFPKFGDRSSSESFVKELLKYEKPVISESVFLGNTTNNVAEWSGLKFGLEKIRQIYQANESEKDQQKIQVQVFLDSELVCKQVLGIYKVKQDHLKPLHQSVSNLSKQFQSFAITHVYRELNKLADELVNRELDGRK
jgi:ribonuclease HI